MKTNARIFWVLAVFFLIVGVVYLGWTWAESARLLETTGTFAGGPGATPHPEWVGTLAILLCAVLAAFLAFYVSKSEKSQGGELPEDRLDANIDDGDPELGHFSPWSWWPITLAGSASILMLGFAIGIWLSYIGAAITIIALVGWVYEYYRGNFAR
ncbi:cytochrome c oxidase subunit 4 [Homoserinimonas hongtaonis]|uniref:cytochrome-c oxidase n=1 Tax=Homoserinimonas hongtaonis TaxID=2079791 RepID=A0A2U1SY72_9MICO|nr:cytochrome c oxidase subunit 4 [Salinibacterium hongtaonis]PWB96580.1 cytochrome c oxidase subunit IV [Salinibacterium hongtaonis]